MTVLYVKIRVVFLSVSGVCICRDAVISVYSLDCVPRFTYSEVVDT